MKNIKKFLLIIIFVAASFFFTSCNLHSIKEQGNYVYPSMPNIPVDVEVGDKEIKGVYLEYRQFTYDGYPKGLEVNFVNKDDRYDYDIVYKNNRNISVGVYEMSATIRRDGYKTETISCSYEIVKADYDMSKVHFNSEKFIYDGTEKSLAITGYLPDGVTVSYINNSLTERGKVEVIARFSHNNPNYNEIPDMKATLEVDWPVLDLSGISFNDKVVEYDGKEHTFTLDGTIPEALEVTYSPNKFTDEGTYTVTATFKIKPGYNYTLETTSLTAKLEIKSSYSFYLGSSGYYVSGYTGTSSTLRIPSTYKGQPVIGIKNSAFRDNKNITEVIMPDSIKYIENYAFKSCSNLSSITFSKNLYSIGDYAFTYCNSLYRVNIPRSVYKIGYESFARCSRLSEVYIPQNVQYIGEDAFGYLPSYVSFNCEVSSKPSGWNSWWKYDSNGYVSWNAYIPY